MLSAGVWAKHGPGILAAWEGHSGVGSCALQARVSRHRGKPRAID